mmetsp:Transcript_22619/g.30585  ORF Transcript_22619/g.30585 Transcript_22619/m.30585 type:complete len:106 (-) Transcript_22619:208-525(-)
MSVHKLKSMRQRQACTGTDAQRKSLAWPEQRRRRSMQRIDPMHSLNYLRKRDRQCPRRDIAPVSPVSARIMANPTIAAYPQAKRLWKLSTVSAAIPSEDSRAAEV